MLRKNVKSLLEQFQVCIFAEIVFGVRCTLTLLGEQRRKRGEREARVSRKGKSAILVPRGRASFSQHRESQPQEKCNTEKSAIHELPVTLRMLKVSSNKSDWLRIRNDYSAHAPEIGPY